MKRLDDRLIDDRAKNRRRHELERTAGDDHGADFACPRVKVSKQEFVDRLKAGEIQVIFGIRKCQRNWSPADTYDIFGCLKRARIADVEKVSQNIGVGVAVRIIRHRIARPRLNRQLDRRATPVLAPTLRTPRP